MPRRSATRAIRQSGPPGGSWDRQYTCGSRPLEYLGVRNMVAPQMKALEQTIMNESTTSMRPVCRVVRAGDTYDGKQGLTYFSGIAAQTVGSEKICMHLLTMPPGIRANAHLHEDHETAIYVISGEAEMWYGHDLEQHMVVGPGDFLYIPAGMPHLPGNPSSTDPCTALIARTDPSEQESVVLLPHLTVPKAIEG